MSHKILYSLAIALVIGLVGCGNSESDTQTEPHFSYDGETGPSKWHTLSDEWKTCENGLTLKPVVEGQMHQSPVDFISAPATTPSFTLDYNKDLEVKMLNNGHSIEFESEGTQAAHLTIAGKVYTLKQFHFHSLSEHTEDGVHADMEGHFVNIADDGSIAVIGVFIDADAVGNSELNKAFSLEIPSEDHTNETATHINPSLILPASSVYSYSGSLTTPPCSEDVKWNVYTDHVGMQIEKVDAFKAHYNHNYRPITGTY